MKMVYLHKLFFHSISNFQTVYLFKILRVMQHNDNVNKAKVPMRIPPTPSPPFHLMAPQKSKNKIPVFYLPMTITIPISSNPISSSQC